MDKQAPTASSSSAGPEASSSKRPTGAKPKAKSKGAVSEDSKKSRQSSKLRDFLAQNRKEMQSRQIFESAIEDPYEKAVIHMELKRKKTGFIYERHVNNHFCLWDKDYPENPRRIEGIYARLKELKLIDQCVNLPLSAIDMCHEDRILLKHSNTILQRLKSLRRMTVSEMENVSSEYDAIYLNKDTFRSAKLALSAVLKLTRLVMNGDIANGFACIRPPGHHAMKNDFCGYCIFNNVAIAAEWAIKEKLAKKILIVDYDVHHGQGTQQMFYDRNDVLYFSIHRYEHGEFWPNLLESNFNFIGEGKGKGYNINIPLNETGLGNGDYMAIVLNVLMPVAYEFSPDLVIVSAGYDAAVGCPEGEMRVTPEFYAHLMTLLSGLADGKIVVALEGGYFVPSLAEGAAMTLRSLLGYSSPPMDNLDQVKASVSESINSAIYYLKPYWNCFEHYETFNFPKQGRNPEEELLIQQDELLVVEKYVGEPGVPPYATRDCYPIPSEQHIFASTSQISQLQRLYETSMTSVEVGYIYDDYLTKHRSDNSKPSLEGPHRIIEIMKVMHEFKLRERCKKIEFETATFFPIESFLKYIHEAKYINSIVQSEIDISKTTDIYINKFTGACALKAASLLLSLVDAVYGAKVVGSGAAIIRPPGHHAGFDNCSGFCFINNVTAAAHYLTHQYSARKVLIVDFDVHHGDGTQQLTYERKDILYISLHRFDHGKFFPKKPTANYNYCGKGAGEGFNVNIPFNDGKMSDADYLHAFHQVVLPIAYAYNPDAVLISAGFDACIHDPLGGYALSPEIYGHFINLLKPLACGRIILALEGGYNIISTAYAMSVCVKALLGDPIPMPDLGPIQPQAMEAVKNVISIHKKYWPVLTVPKKLANCFVTSEEWLKLTDVLARMKTEGGGDKNNESVLQEYNQLTAEISMRSLKLV